MFRSVSSDYNALDALRAVCTSTLAPFKKRNCIIATAFVAVAAAQSSGVAPLALRFYNEDNKPARSNILTAST